VQVDRQVERAQPRWRVFIGSMRFRILAAVLALLTASSAVSILTLRTVLHDRLDDEITTSLRQEMEEFELLVAGRDPVTDSRLGDDIRAVFDFYFAREVPDEGESLLAFVGGELYHTERAADAVDAEDVQDAIAYWLTLPQREEGSLMTEAGEARYVAAPLGDGEVRGLFVVANFPAFERGEINEAIRTQAITQGATILFASLVGLGLAGRVLRPLRSLADTAQNINATDLTQRIPIHGEDEASRIALAFNEMLSRLEAVLATQRQFLDDASHELRVPLTVIRGNVEVLEFEVDADERAAMISLITHEIERMNRIVEDLLLLARSERPGFLAIDTVEINELMVDVHRGATALGSRDWRLEESAQGVINADGQRLTQAMMQLSENACQHTEEGALIRMGARRERESVTFWVQDSGSGVSIEEAERVFERYVRGPDRPAGTGLGLGLSIVAAIADAHGGEARLADNEGRGARFEMVIPTHVEGHDPAGRNSPNLAIR
jgi:two-component system, OmpR family, sensor kinase